MLPDSDTSCQTINTATKSWGKLLRLQDFQEHLYTQYIIQKSIYASAHLLVQKKLKKMKMEPGRGLVGYLSGLWRVARDAGGRTGYDSHSSGSTKFS